MTNNIKKTEPHICPFCGGKNTRLTKANWYSQTIDTITFKVIRKCEDCKKDFTEYYDGIYCGYLNADNRFVTE